VEEYPFTKQSNIIFLSISLFPCACIQSRLHFRDYHFLSLSPCCVCPCAFCLLSELSLLQCQSIRGETFIIIMNPSALSSIIHFISFTQSWKFFKKIFIPRPIQSTDPDWFPFHLIMSSNFMNMFSVFLITLLLLWFCVMSMGLDAANYISFTLISNALRNVHQYCFVGCLREEGEPLVLITCPVWSEFVFLRTVRLEFVMKKPQMTRGFEDFLWF